MTAINIGVNTFGLSQLLSKDFDDTLKRLRTSGYNVLEPCIYFDKLVTPFTRFMRYLNRKIWQLNGGMWSHSYNADEYMGKVLAAGYNVVSVQTVFDVSAMLTYRLNDAIAFMRKYSVKYLVASPNVRDKQEAKRLLPLLSNAVKILADNDMALVLHNHANECYRDEQDMTLLDYYMQNIAGLKLELDVGWVYYAGGDCVEIMRKYADRIVLLHLKDIKKGYPRDKCFTAIGEGDIPLEEILTEAKSLPIIDSCGIIVDQDRSNSDMLHDLNTGINNIITI